MLHSNSFAKKSSIVIALVVAFAAFANLLPQTNPVKAATLYEQYDAAQKKAAELAKKKQDAQTKVNSFNKEAKGYQEQSNRLSAEIALLDVEIAEKQAAVDQLNLSIALLNEEIMTGEAIISQTEYDMEQTQYQVDRKLQGMYLDFKTGIGVSEIDASLDSDDLFKKLQYKSVIVDQTKKLIDELSEKKRNLETEKILLEEKQVQVQRDKQLIDEEKAALDTKKADLNVQRQAFYKMQEDARRNSKAANNEVDVLDDAEAEARAQAQLLQQQIFANTGSVPNGAYVLAGTRIGYQGMTGIATGPHLHLSVRVNGVSVNPCSKLPSGPVGGCSGDGALTFWPLIGTQYFTSSYGNRCYNHNGVQRCTFHDGIDLASPTREAPIFAAHDGWMIRGFDPCSGSICNNGGANYVIICQNKNNCNQGIKTYYYHMSHF